MAPLALTRRQVADRLGLSYGNLRIYEKALEGLLDLREGPNRTLLYDDRALELVESAVALKRDEGWTVAQAARFLRDRRSIRPAGRECSDELRGLREDVQTLARQNAMLFRLGVRLADRLDRLDRQYRDVLRGREQHDLMRTRLPRAVNQ